MFQSLFGTIAGAKDPNNYAQRIPLGSHKLVLKKYNPKKTSPKTPGEQPKVFIESDWMVAESNSTEVAVGETRGWPWFIEASGWAASFAQQNAKACLNAILRSIDLSQLPKNAQGFIVNPSNGQPFLNEHGQPKTEHDIATIGDLAAQNFFRGIQLVAEGTPSYNKKEKKVRMDTATGKPYVDVEWKAVPGQTLETIAAMRATLDQLDPPAPQAALPPQQPNHAPQATMGGYAVQTAQPTFQLQQGQPGFTQTVPPQPFTQTVPQTQVVAAAPGPGNPLAHLLASKPPGTF